MIICIMDISRLDLNLLVTLDALQTYNNLSVAARKLGLSQPMASAHLAKLRHFFDDPLFVRTGRGMRPTPYAEGLREPVRMILEMISRDVLQKSEFRPENSNRTFTITTSDIGVLIFVPPVVKTLRQVAPGIKINCVSIAHEKLESALECGEIDMAIGYFPDLREPNVLHKKLFDHPFACIARENHSSIGDSLTLKEFLAADHLVVNQAGRSQELFERRMAELRLERRVALTLPHFMSVPHLVANSDMIATVPASLGAWYRNGGIKILKPPIDIPLIQLGQFWHRRLDRDSEIRWFRDIVNEQLLDRDASQALSFITEWLD